MPEKSSTNWKCNTRKTTDIYKSDSVVVSVTSMQGWRDEMEDAYCVLLPKDCALDRHAMALRRWRDSHRDVVNDQFLDINLSHKENQHQAESEPLKRETSFFSQGCGSVRFGTSVDVGAVHTKHHVSKLANGSVHTGASGSSAKTTRMTLCGVFDGHGGAYVSEEVAKHMGEWICSTPTFTKHLYERAVHDAFVVNDTKMHDLWNKDRDWFKCAGSTANVVIIIEEFSSEVTRKLEQRRRAVTAGGGGGDADHHNNGGVHRTSSYGRENTFTLSPTSTTSPLTNASNIGDGSSFCGREPADAIPRDEVKIICANAGDSRAIMLRVNGLVVPLSSDHKPSSSTEKGRIIDAKGFVSKEGGCDRIDGVLAVSRGFGDFSFKGNKSLAADRQLVIPNPDIRTTVQKKDFRGRYTFPWVEGFDTRHTFSEAIVRRVNDGTTQRKKRHLRTQAETDLLHLQKCMQWMPAHEAPASASMNDSVNHKVSAASPSTPQNRPPSPQAYGGAAPPSPACHLGSGGGTLRRMPSAQCLSGVEDLAATSGLVGSWNGALGSTAFLEEDEEHDEPPTFEFCDPSATNASLFIAQGCDGIWDCITNHELGEKVLALLDGQLTVVLEGRMQKYADREDRRRLRKSDSNNNNASLMTVNAVSPTTCGGERIQSNVDVEVAGGVDDSVAGESSSTDEEFEGLDATSPITAELSSSSANTLRLMRPFRSISEHIDAAKITEAIVQFCLEQSYAAPNRDRALSTPCGTKCVLGATPNVHLGVSPGQDNNSSKTSTSAGSSPTVRSPISATPPSAMPSVGTSPVAATQDTQTATAVFSPPFVVSGSPPPSSQGGGSPAFPPPKPLNVIGTDNMTFALIFFKEGIAARAMLLHHRLLQRRKADAAAANKIVVPLHHEGGNSTSASEVLAKEASTTAADLSSASATDGITTSVDGKITSLEM